jgi:DNA-3-methyladenine glycosylase
MPLTSLAKLGSRLTRRFYARPTDVVAKALLGQWVLRKTDSGEWLGGKIVETEAYLATDDPASHSYRGPTKRNGSMFRPPGTLYVYSIHAKHCMNVSTEREGVGSAVLIRAIEPVYGLHEMSLRRNQQDPRRLTRGPGMLCQALDINRTHDGIDLITSDEIALLSGQQPSPDEILTGPRIGISHAKELGLRFFLRGNRFVSGSVTNFHTPLN